MHNGVPYRKIIFHVAFVRYGAGRCIMLDKVHNVVHMGPKARGTRRRKEFFFPSFNGGGIQTGKKYPEIAFGFGVGSCFNSLITR